MQPNDSLQREKAPGFEITAGLQAWLVAVFVHQKEVH